ncbi:MAG: hypothetical protein ACHBNF_20715 [Chromatiales bacterium]
MAERNNDKGATEAKWSAEAYNFLRLFRRIGTQLDGLLLLQIGWVLLLWLVGKLSPSDGPYTIGLPWVTLRGTGEHSLKFIDVAVKDLYILGALALFAIWLVTSRLHLLVTRPILVLLRTVCGTVVLIAGVVLLVASLPVWLALLPVEKYLATRQRTEEKEKNANGQTLRLDRNADRNGQPNQGFKASWLQDKIGETTGFLLATVVPRGSIGLAPIHTFSFDEEFLAARVPLQLFTEAEARLRGGLRHMPSAIYPHVIVLPLGLRIAGPQQARALRRWLGLDALLWGTYTSTKPARLWINIAAELPASENRDKEKHAYVLGTSAEDTYQALIVDQDSPVHASIALALALRYAAVARDARRLRYYPKALDRFGLNRYAIRDAIESFVVDLLHGFTGPTAWDTPEPSAGKLAVILAVDWVKRQLEDYQYASPRRDRASLTELKRVIERCVVVAPGNPEGHYLLALFALLDSNLSAATASIDRGWHLDTARRLPDVLFMCARVYLFMNDADRGYEGDERRLNFATAAVYAALALRLDSHNAKDVLRRYLVERSGHKGRMLLGMGDEPVGGERYLYAILEVSWFPDPNRDQASDSVAAGPSESHTGSGTE